jgi:O-antigen ligase
MAFFAFIIFLIVIFVQPQEFMPMFKGMPLVAYCMGVAFVGYIFNLLMNTKKIRLFDAPQNILMIIFWFIIIISTLQIGWLKFTLETIIEWGKFVLIYFIAIKVIDSENKLNIAILTIVLASSFLAISGILQKYGIDITGVGLGRDERIRGVGIFDTNQLAYTLAFISPLIFAFFLKVRSVLIKAFLLVVFCAFYYAIFLTVSRGGILCSVAVLALLFIVFNRNKFVKIFGFGIGAFLFVLFQKIAPRLQTISSYQTDSSAKGRLNVWGEALMTLKSYPIFGIGKGQFKEFFSLSPHSSYIQVLSELGLVGLFIWLSLFYFSLKNLMIIDTLATNQDDKRKILFAKIFQVSLYSYLIGSFFSGNAYYITFYILLALVVAFQYMAFLKLPYRRAIFSLKDVRNIGFIEIAIILLIKWLS